MKREKLRAGVEDLNVIAFSASECIGVHVTLPGLSLFHFSHLRTGWIFWFLFWFLGKGTVSNMVVMGPLPRPFSPLLYSLPGDS